MQKTIEINKQTIFEPGQNKMVILNTLWTSQKQAGDSRPVFHTARLRKDQPWCWVPACMVKNQWHRIIRKVVTRSEVQNLNTAFTHRHPGYKCSRFYMRAGTLPDGRDLNRCFPGSRRGSMAATFTPLILKHILPVIDFGVDFPFWAAQRQSNSQLRCVFSFPTTLPSLTTFLGPTDHW